MDTTFIDALASEAPTPGGGSASAYVGALGAALGSMVGNLTLGRKAYEDVQDDIIFLLEKTKKVQEELLQLVQADIDVFTSLSTVYKLPRETASQKQYRDEQMQRETRKAIEVPLQTMKACCSAIDLHQDYCNIGNKNLISDVGAGVACCEAALKAASLNIFINVKTIKDINYKADVLEQANQMLEVYSEKANKIFEQVMQALRQ